MPQTKMPPHSIEAEQGVLGAIISDSDRLVDVLAKLAPKDFYESTHRDIFQAIVDLYESGQAVDLLTVTQKLKDQDAINAAGGAAYIAELTTLVPSGAHAPIYADLIKDKALHRAVAAAGDAINQLGRDESLTATEMLERAEQKLLVVSRVAAGDDMEQLTEIISRRYDSFSELHAAEDKDALLGLRTGFADLDRKIEGMEAGSLTIIAARPSIGKTSLAISIAQHVLEKQGKDVAIFSLEMSKAQILDRLIASKIDLEMYRKLKKGTLDDDEFAGLGPLFDSFRHNPLYVDDAAVSIAELRSKARRVKMRHGLDLLIVDYLQLIDVTDRVSGDNRTQQVTYISRCLKNLAGELGCPVIALSQLSRKVEERAQPTPQLADLRDSGSIEQDADTVLMLYREQVYNEDCSNPGLTDVYIRKNRNGETGRISLHFDERRMTFTSLDPRETQRPSPKL